MINGRWSTDASEIKSEILSFYKSKFQEKRVTHPKLINPNFRKLDDNSIASLEASITSEEIKTAIWACGNEKSPGPDGFTFKFWKRYWDTLKEDIVFLMKHFETHGNLDRGCNSSFITLVPLTISDYRPISLIGSL